VRREAVTEIALLHKLMRIIALQDDPGASAGERANCRAIGEKIAAEFGVAFDRGAVERALAAGSVEPFDLAAAIERAYREFETGRRATRTAEKTGCRGAGEAERDRPKRARGGTAAPRWNDLEGDHAIWLARMAALRLSAEDRVWLEGIAAEVRRGRLGLHGSALERMNRLLAIAFDRECRSRRS
jgi:hypothetical protein